MISIKQFISTMINRLLLVDIHPRVKNIISSTEDFSYITEKYLHISSISCRLANKYLACYLEELKKKVTYISDKTSLCERWYCQFMGASDETKMLMIKVFYVLNIFGDKIASEILRFAKETNNKDYRYWSVMDISKIAFLSQKGFYKEFYSDRRECLRLIANEHQFQKVKKDGFDSETVCVITYLLDDSIFNSAQRVAMMFAERLSMKYKHVHVIVMDSFYISDNEKKGFHTIFERSSSKDKQGAIEELFGNKIKVDFVSKNRYQQRLQEALDKIYELNPCRIIDISDEFSAISYLYNQDFPVFYIPLRYYTSSSFFYKILVPVELACRATIVHPCINVDQIEEWCFPEYVPPVSETMKRENYNLPSNAFIITTIGNNERACDDDFVDMMYDLLEDREDFVWILVGQEGSIYLHEKCRKMIQQKKIIEWGFEKNLSGFCNFVDVLVRPNTTGSSGATAIAAQQGIPIVLTDYLSDPLRWLGMEYAAGTSYADLASDINRLYSDKEYYKLRVELTKKKVSEATNTEVIWSNFYDILEDKSTF